MAFLLQPKITADFIKKFEDAVRYADGSFTKLSCHSILLKQRSVMHHSDGYGLASKILILLRFWPS